MSLAALVVVINGAIVASAPPAELVAGHVMAPVVPVMTRLTDRAAVAGDTITLARQGHVCTLHVGTAALVCDGISRPVAVAPFERDGVAYVPLAEVTRAFGGSAGYDAAERIVTLQVPPPTEVRTPAPFDPTAPQVAPTEVFTPSPPPATPRPVDTTSPLPRRTAIPLIVTTPDG